MRLRHPNVQLNGLLWPRPRLFCGIRFILLEGTPLRAPSCKEPAEDHEGEVGVDSASHSISTSCSDASKSVATQGDMGEGACGVRNVVLWRIISHGMVSTRALCGVACEDLGSRCLKLERGS